MDKIKFAVGVFDKCAAEYQEKFMDVSPYAHVLDAFCAHIPNSKASVLDIACGPGNIAKYILSKRPGYQLLGVDLAPNMLALAAQNNPTAKFQLMDCRDIVKLDRVYDAVICGFCMPYLSKEEAIQLIADVAKILLPGGVFYFSTMEDDYSKSGMQTSSGGDSLYMYYHEAGYLCDALAENGFRIISQERQDYVATNGVKSVDLLTLAVKRKV